MIKKIFDRITIILFAIWVLSGILVFVLSQSNTWLSIMAGTFTCFLTVLVISFCEKYRFYNNLNHLTSDDWIGWAVVERKIVKHKTENPDIEYNSFVTITYEHDNILDIKLRHRESDKSEKNRCWEGKIEINKQYLTKGSLSGRYTDSHEVRSIDIILYQDEGANYIYLIPVNNNLHYLQKLDKAGEKYMTGYDYGIEVLIKKRYKNSNQQAKQITV